MKKVLYFFLFLLPILSYSQQQETPLQQELKKLNWIDGPSSGVIGDKAKIQIPKNYVFLGAQDTKKYIELMGNPPVDNHYLIAPKDLRWFAVFTFNPSGYVKDDEKIDADELMKNLKEGDIKSNEERKRLGMHTLYTDGWQVPPHYDASTKRLEWGVRLRDEGGAMNINYTSRLLSRTGVMSAILVADTETLQNDTNEYKTTLMNFNFVSGESYSEFKLKSALTFYQNISSTFKDAAIYATKLAGATTDWIGTLNILCRKLIYTNLTNIY
jgi:uncharacterized membrane-anchored protein